MDENNHSNWLNKGPWYNTSICSRLNVSLFENFITHARTNRYNILCVLVAHDKKQPDYEYYESSIGDRLIPKHVTTEALEALVPTLDFIEIWIKQLDVNYDARSVAYRTAMKDMFKQISTIITKPLSTRQKVHKLMSEIGGGWYMVKLLRDYHY